MWNLANKVQVKVLILLDQETPQRIYIYIYMSLHMSCQAAKGFNGYAMQHQNDSKYMYVLTHVCMGKLCSPRLNMVV